MVIAQLSITVLLKWFWFMETYFERALFHVFMASLCFIGGVRQIEMLILRIEFIVYMFQNIETKNPLQIKQYIYIMFVSKI